MHSVKEGPANQSYGLQVAALAGVPEDVIRNAKQKLRQLEEQTAQETVREQQQISLFPPEQPHPVIERLSEVKVDEISPRDALNFLYELKKQL